jgi:hypothetical protein
MYETAILYPKADQGTVKIKCSYNTTWRPARKNLQKYLDIIPFNAAILSKYILKGSDDGV